MVILHISNKGNSLFYLNCPNSTVISDAATKLLNVINLWIYLIEFTKTLENNDDPVVRRFLSMSSHKSGYEYDKLAIACDQMVNHLQIETHLVTITFDSNFEMFWANKKLEKCKSFFDYIGPNSKSTLLIKLTKVTDF